MKKMYLVLFVVFFTSCAGTYNSDISSGYKAPQGNEIALLYLDHSNINISNMATQVFSQQLASCGINNFLTAEETMAILEENKINIPRRLTPSFITSLKGIVPKKYLMTGGVSIWKKGSVGFPVASTTEVSVSLTMYDIKNGEVVWAVSGQEEGAAGIFAEKPEDKARIVFEKMIKKWPGFCKTSSY